MSTERIHEIAEEKGLYELEKMLNEQGFSFASFGINVQIENMISYDDIIVIEEEIESLDNIDSYIETLNECQRNAFDDIIGSINGINENKLFFY